MKQKRLAITGAIILLITGIILGLTISAKMDIQSITVARDIKPRTEISSSSEQFLDNLNNALSEVAEKVKPSVVNISTTKTVTLRDNPLRHFFNDPFFRRFFGEDFWGGGQRKYKTSALGSGVIVSEDGYILTNNHVVKDADEIIVRLVDKREFKGKVIGSDPKTDLAVIKINAKGLPAIEIGDSDKLRVGEIVLAIGNPFGLSHTITMGIVSATGRSNVGVADYEDFIQTDAAINPGNSGGALVNTKGQLVGINTAIFSTSGGYMGIGFAIPSNMAKSVMESIIKYGKVVRGWLGVTIQDLNQELAKQFGVGTPRGALVTDVAKDSPADKGGLKRGDVIVEFQGKKIKDVRHLRNLVAETPPGTKVTLKVIRDGREKTLKVTLGEFPEELTARRGHFSNALKGVNVQNLTPELKRRLDIPARIKGVLVTEVEPDSPAFGLLHRGDVIQEVNRRAIKNVKDYEEALSDIGPKDVILLLVYRKGGHIYITIRP